MIAKKKKIVLLLLLIVMLGIVCVFGVIAYKNWKTEKTITEYNSQIDKIEKSFSEEEERTAKLEILKELIDETNKYSKSENGIKEVKQNYKKAIQSMKSCFIEMYDTEVEQNTLLDKATITDKEALNNAKTNLTTLLDAMKSEFELTLSEAEYTDYVDKINELIDGYANRVAEIEKAEEEARLRAEEEARLKTEAEAKAKAEQETKAEQTNKSNNIASSNASNNANASNNNVGGRREISTLNSFTFTDDNTGITIITYYDQYGNIYDENGYPTGENIYW